MDSFLDLIEIISNNNFINILSLTFGFLSFILGIIAIFIAFRFYYLAKATESNTIFLLSKISTKSDDLGSISIDLIKKLTDFSTYGLKEHIETILKYTNQPIPPYSPIKEIKKTDKDINKLYDTYIRYYYFLYKINFYAPTSELTHSDKSIEQIAQTMDESYSEFSRIDKILNECDKELLRKLSNYDLYITIRNLKDNVKKGSFFLDLMKSIGK